MTKKQIVKARKLHDKDKLSYRKISKILGIPRTTLHDALNPELRKATQERYRKKYQNDEAYLEHQREYNCKYRATHRELRRKWDREYKERCKEADKKKTHKDRETFWERLKIWEKPEKKQVRRKHLELHKKSIYFIEAIGSGFVKIGRSYSGEDRTKELQTGCPYPLKLLCELEIDSDKTEKRLQKRFAKYRFRGEWFYASKEIRQFIKEINDKKKD